MPRGRPKKSSEEMISSTHKEIPNISEIDKVNPVQEYQIQGKVKSISAMCRQSVSIRGNYYTFEYKEERELPLTNNINLVKEKDALWYSVNSEVDNQINNLIEWLEEQRQSN